MKELTDSHRSVREGILSEKTVYSRLFIRGYVSVLQTTECLISPVLRIFQLIKSSQTFCTKCTNVYSALVA